MSSREKEEKRCILRVREEGKVGIYRESQETLLILEKNKPFSKNYPMSYYL